MASQSDNFSGDDSPPIGVPRIPTDPNASRQPADTAEAKVEPPAEVLTLDPLQRALIDAGAEDGIELTAPPSLVANLLGDTETEGETDNSAQPDFKAVEMPNLPDLAVFGDFRDRSTRCWGASMAQHLLGDFTLEKTLACLPDWTRRLAPDLGEGTLTGDARRFSHFITNRASFYAAAPRFAAEVDFFRVITVASQKRDPHANGGPDAYFEVGSLFGTVLVLDLSSLRAEKGVRHIKDALPSGLLKLLHRPDIMVLKQSLSTAVARLKLGERAIPVEDLAKYMINLGCWQRLTATPSEPFGVIDTGFVQRTVWDTHVRPCSAKKYVEVYQMPAVEPWPAWRDERAFVKKLPLDGPTKLYLASEARTLAVAAWSLATACYEECGHPSQRLLEPGPLSTEWFFAPLVHLFDMRRKSQIKIVSAQALPPLRLLADPPAKPVIELDKADTDQRKTPRRGKATDTAAKGAESSPPHEENSGEKGDRAPTPPPSTVRQADELEARARGLFPKTFFDADETGPSRTEEETPDLGHITFTPLSDTSAPTFVSPQQKRIPKKKSGDAPYVPSAANDDHEVAPYTPTPVGKTPKGQEGPNDKEETPERPASTNLGNVSHPGETKPPSQDERKEDAAVKPPSTSGDAGSVPPKDLPREKEGEAKSFTAKTEAPLIPPATDSTVKRLLPPAAKILVPGANASDEDRCRWLAAQPTFKASPAPVSGQGRDEFDTKIYTADVRNLAKELTWPRPGEWEQLEATRAFTEYHNVVSARPTFLDICNGCGSPAHAYRSQRSVVCPTGRYQVGRCADGLLRSLLCPYPYCRTPTEHLLPVCPALHGLCFACGTRGHLTSYACFDKRRYPSADRRVFDVFAPLGVLTQLASKRNHAGWGFFYVPLPAARSIDYDQLRELDVPEARAVIRHAHWQERGAKPQPPPHGGKNPKETPAPSAQAPRTPEEIKREKEEKLRAAFLRDSMREQRARSNSGSRSRSPRSSAVPPKPPLASRLGPKSRGSPNPKRRKGTDEPRRISFP